MYSLSNYESVNSYLFIVIILVYLLCVDDVVLCSFVMSLKLNKFYSNDCVTLLVLVFCLLFLPSNNTIRSKKVQIRPPDIF